MRMAFRGFQKPADPMQQMGMLPAMPQMGAMPPQMQAIGQGFAPQEPPVMPDQPKPSFLAPGGAGRAIAGTIGDTLLQMNRIDPIYAPAMQRQQMMDAKRQQAEAERYEPQKVGDTIVRLNPQTGQYETVYSAPANAPAPTAIERNADYFKSIGRDDLASAYIENQANPMQAVTVYGPDGSQGLQFIRPGQMGGGAPKAPVGKLTPIGGAAPQGAGGFRR